jgi:apolipoprotein N-acyltransferase
VPGGSAVLMSLAFPPFDLSLLVFVCLAPWLAWTVRQDGRRAAAGGYLFGLVLFLFQMHWVSGFVGRWTGDWRLGAVPWLLAAAIAGLYFALFGWLAQRASSSGWVWLVPLLWAAVESARAYVPVLAFPWANLAHPLWRFPGFVQHAAYGTVFLVSAWVALANLLLALALWPPASGPPKPRTAVRAALLVCLPLLLSTFRAAQPPAGDRLNAALGQPGVDMAFTPPQDERRMLDAAAPRLVEAAARAGADLLVLPEGFADVSKRVPPPTVVGDAPPLSVVYGGKRASGNAVFQTAFAYDARSGEWSHADKTRLVVFGEYVPFRDLPVMQAFRLPGGDLTAATELRQVEAAGVAIGPLMCFEGVFPDLSARHGADGSRLLVQMSIDDWYEGTPAWDQLWQSSVWRSIESGLPLVRVGGRGLSLATDARGRLLDTAAPGREECRVVPLTVPERSDAWDGRFGFVWLCWAVAATTAARGLGRRGDGGTPG